MITVSSLSGGQSSAYIAAHFPADVLLFALVCIDDPQCAPSDKKLVQQVSDRIGREFIATAEDDTILSTMFDLEQYVGQRIEWVAGPSFDEVADNGGGWLPNKLHRYCTVQMKLNPMFEFWRDNIGEPCAMQIGFRAGEESRAQRMRDRCNGDGLLVHRAIVGKHKNGNNRWQDFPWQRPEFPLIENGVFRDNIVEYWRGRSVRFAPRNNCVGCFHRNPLLLRLMWDDYPEKMEWFASQERKPGKNRWRHNEATYDEIRRHKMQHSLSFDDFNDCDSGHCGL